MHHMYPMGKGDPLCPLGFHPQVRWPTRCKRCFRDYKEHGGKKKEQSSLHRNDTTASSPSLSWSSQENDRDKRRSWASSTNLAEDPSPKEKSTTNNSDSGLDSPSSWISTPDLVNLEDDTQPVTTVSIKLPKRKLKPIDTGQRSVSDSVRRADKPSVFNTDDSLSSRTKTLANLRDKPIFDSSKRIQVKEVKTFCEEPTNHDVQFLIKVKRTPSISEETRNSISENEDDCVSIAGTEATDTTLIDTNDRELRDQLDSLRKELESTKTKCERLEREKSDILLRRLAAMDATTTKSSTGELQKLQKKCKELQQQLEDYTDDKKSLSLKVKELEEEIQSRPNVQVSEKIADELRAKLLAAETLCEELMDENEDVKRELRDMVEQMDELQDNFREDQAVEYTSLKKELDQTTKNCRILSFKLRKAERKTEQLEQEKGELDKKFKEISGGQTTLNNLEKIKHLEHELMLANEVSLRLQNQLEEANQKVNKFEEQSKTITIKKKPTLLEATSRDNKVSRESLTRGGSQEDPAQLLRDLQDSLEREADLREQLKFAEEEAQNLRKKASRIEDDNESLVLQLKKMAGRARSRKLSPTNTKLSPEPSSNEKAAIEEDPTELKLQLELSEQEASVLRKKVEELEADNDRIKFSVKDLQDKLFKRNSTKKSPVQNEVGNSLESQKLKVLEDETNDLRKKLIEKERDCERLHAELTLNKKRSKGMQKSKSLDLDQQTIDLKRQLQVIEEEASVLRTKVQSLENENDKLNTENKRLQLSKGTKAAKTDKNVEKYIDQISKLELQLEESNKKIKRLEEAAQHELTLDKLNDKYKKYLDRKPKKITNLTSKDQMKIIITDLETEIGDIITLLTTTENQRRKLEDTLEKSKSHTAVNEKIKELEEVRRELEKVQEEMNNQKVNSEQEKSKSEDLNKTLKKTNENLSKLTEENNGLKEEIEKLSKDLNKLNDSKKRLDLDLSNLQSDLKKAQSDKEDLTKQSNKNETLLSKKETELKQLKSTLETKEKLISELTKKTANLSNLEKKMEESESKHAKTDAQRKSEIKQLEERIEQERNINKNREADRTKLTNQWDDDRNNLYKLIDDLKSKIKTLETTIETRENTIQQLEENLKTEKEALEKSYRNKSTEVNPELNKAKDDLKKMKKKFTDTLGKLEAAEKAQLSSEDKLKKSELTFELKKTELEKKSTDLEAEILNKQKKLDILKANHDKVQKNHELELNALRSKIRKLETSSETGSKKTNEVKQLQESIEKLESNLVVERRKYDDLTAKYEILEEEHVATKAKLVTEKEVIDHQCALLKQEISKLEGDKKSLSDKEDTWKKERIDLQQKLKDYQSSSNGNDLEKARLKGNVKEKQLELEQLKKEYDVINDQLDYMRKESDELRKKLDDYQKVNKIQRNISADSSNMEKEIQQLRGKLTLAEKSKKAALAEYKMRYDSQISVVSAELQSLQGQVTRFKRERDTYKHMLESAQKTIGELKQGPKIRKETSSPLHYDEVEESRNKIATLEQQISCMEDELSEARLEASKLKTELVSERSQWEVRISELRSRVNELEEEKILNSGRTKIAGIRTRMELAWQKEREEQQRILQETATLARDLRQTLFEVERERDKERLEAKRKQEQFKKSSEEDQDENKRKITELQCDLLELRDAHAKLRTTNEKLRREKERYEREREQFKLLIHGKKRNVQRDDSTITTLLDQIDNLKQLAPELFFTKDNQSPNTPTLPKRTKSRSRESSPSLTSSSKETSLGPEDKKDKIHSIMQKLVDVTEDLRRSQRSTNDDAEYERDRLRQLMMSSRRATSSEHENSKYTRLTSQRSSSALRRRSLSLEQNMESEQAIWKNTDNDSTSSMQSLDMGSDVERWSKRDTSMDSRLSGGSTQSDIAGGEKKKKKGIIGKLKKLTKSRSIDDQDMDAFPPARPLSNSKKTPSNETIEEERGSKKDLKERITGIFKKSGSSSRSNSLERTKTSEAKHDTSSTQRPLMKTATRR